MAIVLDDSAPYTSTDNIINGALRLIGVLAEGETPSPETSADALMALRQMIDSWSIERLSVYCTQTQDFVWPANEASQTIGPTGDFIGVRPVSIDPSTYFTSGELSYGLTFLNQDQYNGIAQKGVTSTYPQVCYVSNTFPNMTLTVYPVPEQDLTWHIVSVQALAQPAALATTLYFPPGYLRAFRYNLACELAPEFGVEPSAQVMRIAMYSKRNLKRINNPNDLLAMPVPLLPRNGRFDIYDTNGQ